MGKKQRRPQAPKRDKRQQREDADRRRQYADTFDVLPIPRSMREGRS